MAKKYTDRPAQGNANRVAGLSPTTPEAGQLLSPDLNRELYGLVSRAIKAANVDAMAGECGVDRSTIWKWAKHPERIHAGAILTLAEYDPDVESLSRIAGCLLRAVAARALAHQAQGRTLQVFTEFGPGRWGR